MPRKGEVGKRKAKLSDLSERVKRLETENLKLRNELKVGKDTADSDAEARSTLFADLKAAADADDASRTSQLLDRFVADFSDYGAARRERITTHLTQLERLLLPSQVTKMVLWMLNQDDAFFERASATDGTDGGMWRLILDAVDATDRQRMKIEEHRGDTKKLAIELRRATRECAALRTRMARKNEALVREMEELRQILTPVQLAKFLLWVENNRATTHMLGELERGDDVAAQEAAQGTPTAAAAAAAAAATASSS